MPVVGLDALGDADHDQDDAGREGEVAEPVDRLMRPGGQVPQPHVGPDRAEDAERDRDQEDQPPVDRGEHAAQDQPDERPAHAGDVVDAEGHAALVLRERVGQDGAGVAQQERAADALHDPEQQQVERAAAAGHPVDGEHERGRGVDDEPEVVHLDPAEQVTQAAHAHHQHAAGDQVAEDHPEQVLVVARDQRVELDAAEDVRHRDDHDRRVDGHQQCAHRRVGQRHPFVPAVRRREAGPRGWRWSRSAIRARADRHPCALPPSRGTLPKLYKILESNTTEVEAALPRTSGRSSILERCSRMWARNGAQEG